MIRLLTGHDYTYEIIRLINAATITIDLAMYLVNTTGKHANPARDQLHDALMRAPARGVRCRLLLPAGLKLHSNHPASRASSTQLHAAGWTIRESQPHRLLHSKFWVVDNKTSVIGSHNLSAASLQQNIDTSILMHCQAFAPLLASHFAELWACANTQTPYLLPNG